MSNLNGSSYFLHEILSWERALEFLLTENSFLKTRLSLSVDVAPGKKAIDDAERFQTRFLKNDESLNRVLKDVMQQQERMKRTYLTTNPQSEKKFEIKQSELRKEVEALEKEFAEMKSEFNAFLVSAL